MPHVRKGQREFSAVVDEAEYRKFVGHLPMNGATTWFIRTALRNFNQQLDQDPDLVQIVQRAVMAATREAREGALRGEY